MFQKQLYSVFYIEICGTTGPLSKEQASCQQNYFRDWPQVLWISLVIRGRNTYTGIRIMRVLCVISFPQFMADFEETWTTSLKQKFEITLFSHFENFDLMTS